MRRGLRNVIDCVRRRSRQRAAARLRVPLRIEVDAPELEWRDEDAAALAWFFESPAGQNLKQLLYYELYTRALAKGTRDAYAQGVIDGHNAQLARILSLADQSLSASPRE